MAKSKTKQKRIWKNSTGKQTKITNTKKGTSKVVFEYYN